MSNVKVTCRYCKNKIDKKNAFIEEYINDNLEIKNRYFCNEKCYNDKQNEIKRKERAKELKVKARELSRELCGLDQKEKSIYFSSTYKIITDKFDNELIYDYCTKYKNDILNLLNSKDFKTVNSRIKYCLVMLENQLQHYILEKEQPKLVEEKKEIEVDDFDISVRVKKKERRDINDILGL